MDKILARLEEQGELTPEVEKRLREFWYYGVERITDGQIRAAVTHLLEDVVPWQFFVAPAASTKKYHPRWQNEPGGLVRHTAEMCVGMSRAATKYPTLTDEKDRVLDKARDVLLAAVILHDAFKNVTSGGLWGRYTNRKHNLTAAAAWQSAALRFDVPEWVKETITRAILWHEGHWAHGVVGSWEGMRRDPYISVLHDLDMAHSDRDFGLMFEPKDMPLS